MKSTMIRPGLLVNLKTTVKGGVSYQKEVIEPEHRQGESTIATWQTTRQVTDAAEHERAVVARGKARNAVTRACCVSTFGLLCPIVNEENLAEGIDEAIAIAAEFNRGATCTRIEVFVITGRVADNDEQAARAIGSEVRDLIGAMESAVRKADPEAIRDAANRARAIAGMLGDGTQQKVTAAIAEVRKIARDIVKRVEESGERAADVVQGLKLEALSGARFAVLDMMGEGEEIVAEVTPVAGRSIDIEPADVPQSAGPATPSFEF